MLTQNNFFVEKCGFVADDATAKKRKEIAERLRNGRPVDIEGNNGEMKTSEDVQTSAGPKLKVDKDKLAADDAAAKKRKAILVCFSRKPLSSSDITRELICDMLPLSVKLMILSTSSGLTLTSLAVSASPL